MLQGVSINVCLCLGFNQHSLDGRLEEVQLLIKVVELKWESYVCLLESRDLYFLSQLEPLNFQ
jgi:hypothetical protein